MTDLATLKEGIAKYRSAKSEVDALLKDNAPSVIAKAFQEILVDCPEVVVYWKQGTPSFNDGDPCRFSVHDLWICPEGTDYWEENAITDEGCRQDPEDMVDDSNKVLCTSEQQEKLYAVWGSLDSYILQQAFGEACVTITSDSVSTDEFDRY